jgi:hypothetical protein
VTEATETEVAETTETEVAETTGQAITRRRGDTEFLDRILGRSPWTNTETEYLDGILKRNAAADYPPLRRRLLPARGANSPAA